MYMTTIDAMAGSGFLHLSGISGLPPGVNLDAGDLLVGAYPVLHVQHDYLLKRRINRA